MNKLLLGCAIAMFTATSFAANFNSNTETTRTIYTAQSEQTKTDNDEQRYYILTGAVTAQDLASNILFKNIKMDKRPVPMQPVPKAQ